MDEYVILLPLAYNDGKAVETAVLRELMQLLYDLAEGYTIEGEVKGAYRMKSGRKQEDRLLKVWVLIPPESVPKLRALVRGFCIRLNQESMWLEKEPSIVEFIHPD
ncbi:MAG TPA: hypothetical protein VH253_15785 [Phycisphaerae bacterium]|nr:hypothetical protein [Phycisphaerae bacterium]